MLTAQPTENPSKSLPIWLSIPIILLCLFAGGWITYWYVKSDPLSHESKILGDAPVQAQWNGWGGPARVRNNGGGGGGGGANRRRAIQDQSDGRWDIHTDVAHVNVSLSGGKLNWHIIAYTGNYQFVSDEAKNTLYSARAIVTDKDNTRVVAMKLTPDQVKKLRALSSPIMMNISEADKTQLGTMIESYINAAPAERNTIEPKVVQLLDQIAVRSMGPTKKLAEERAAQINAIITPEMWKQDAAMGGGGNAPAKPAPAR